MTIGPQTHRLPDPFVVMATMNPIDAEGTYALPLAQMDRFLMKVLVGYPTPDEELSILDRFGGEPRDLAAGVATLADVVAWRHAGPRVHLEPGSRVISLRSSTRRARRISTSSAGRARARRWRWPASRAPARFVDGRDYVAPDDVKALAPAVFRHRLAFGYRTVTDNVDPETIVGGIVAGVGAP